MINSQSSASVNNSVVDIHNLGLNIVDNALMEKTNSLKSDVKTSIKSKSNVSSIKNSIADMSPYNDSKYHEHAKK